MVAAYLKTWSTARRVVEPSTTCQQLLASQSMAGMARHCYFLSYTQVPASLEPAIDDQPGALDVLVVCHGTLNLTATAIYVFLCLQLLLLVVLRLL